MLLHNYIGNVHLTANLMSQNYDLSFFLLAKDDVDDFIVYAAIIVGEVIKLIYLSHYHLREDSLQ